jgi:hypothetical protein
VISVTGRSRGLPPFRRAAAHAAEAVPVGLRADHTDLTARPLRLPERHEIPMVGDVRLVVEHYSRRGFDRTDRPRETAERPGSRCRCWLARTRRDCG